MGLQKFGTMLQLESVSKCKKLSSANNQPSINSILFANITGRPNLETKHALPEPPLFCQPTQQEFLEMYKIRDFEDANFTKHISQQILIFRVIMAIIGVLSIILCRFNASLTESERAGDVGDYILIFHSAITLSLLAAVYFKHLLKIKLADRQLVKFTPIQINFGGISGGLIFELLAVLSHPNCLAKGVSVKVRDPVYQMESLTEVNDILQILMLLRAYLIFSTLVWSSIFLSPRGNRICRIYGTRSNLQFGMKCVFNSSPLVSLVLIFISLLYTLSEMVRISEKEVMGSQLGELRNSLWCVMITMGTVGYGDYSPKTYLGRGILFLASVAGIIISSLLILTLSTDLSMQLSQNKAHVTLQRLVLRQNVTALAQDVMHQSVLLSQKDKAHSQSLLQELKRKADEVKYTLRKIKNIIDVDNINEEMDRLFEVLDDNMKEAYENQLKYAAVLNEVSLIEESKICEMRFSYTDEIENVIKDR